MNYPQFTYTDEEVSSIALEFLRDPARPALKSAQAALGDHSSLVGKCLYAINELVKEPRFEAAKAELKKQGAGEIAIPTKDEVLKRIWILSDVGFPGDRIKALELFSKVNGWLDSGKVVVNNNTTNKVMEVPVSSTDKEWEVSLKEQQAALMDNGTKH